MKIIKIQKFLLLLLPLIVFTPLIVGATSGSITATKTGNSPVEGQNNVAGVSSAVSISAEPKNNSLAITTIATVTGNCNLGFYGKGEPVYKKSDTLYFGASNDNVLLSPIDDNIYQGSYTCTVSFSKSVSEDPNFNNLSIASVSFTVKDNDTAPAATPAPKQAPAPEKQQAEVKKTPVASSEPKAPEKPANQSVAVKDREVSGLEIFEINSEETITFKGRTIPNGLIVITVYSEPKTYKTTADKNGDYTIAVNDLPEGEHHAEIVVTDPDSKLSSSPVTLANFRVSEASADDVSESIQNIVTTEENTKSSVPLYIIGFILLITIAAVATYLLKFRKKGDVSNMANNNTNIESQETPENSDTLSNK